MAVRKTKSGLALKRWFKEDWKDVTGVVVKNGNISCITKGYRQKTPKPLPSLPKKKRSRISKEAYWPTGR